MKMDTANRAFIAILVVGLAGYLVLGAAACGLLAFAAFRLSVGGVEAATDVWPALLFLSLAGTGAVLGFLSLRRQIEATSRLDEHIFRLRLPPSQRLERAAQRIGIQGRVYEVDDPTRFTFTYGLVRPRVVVSRELVDAATDDELDAVLIHERYHVRNFDPVKLLVVRTLPSVFFFLPSLRDFRSRYLAGRELAADHRALRRSGKGPLASAIYKVVAGPSWAEFGPAAALGGTQFLEARVTQIESGREPPPPPLSPTRMAISAAGATVLLASLIVASATGAFSMMQSMPSTEGALHGMSWMRPLGAVGMALSGIFWGWVAWVVIRAVARRRG
jgi:beta-lactamase regulating signal transducer with metallopeptidase domain